MKLPEDCGLQGLATTDSSPKAREKRSAKCITAMKERKNQIENRKGEGEEILAMGGQNLLC
jgi:hypothetical protein